MCSALLETVQLLPKSYIGVDYIAGLFDPRCHGNAQQRPQQPYNVDFQRWAPHIIVRIYCFGHSASANTTSFSSLAN